MFRQWRTNPPKWLARLGKRDKIPRRWWYPELPIIAFGDTEEWKRQNDEVSNTIRRTVLTLVIYCAFCIIMLGAPDASLLSASENINLPFTDTAVSYQGFLIFAPLILIGLSIFLHVNLRQLNSFDYHGNKFPLPFIFNQKNTSAIVVSSIIFYWLVPVVLLTFSWKTIPRSGITPALLLIFSTVFTSALIWVQIRRLNRNHKWYFRLRMSLSLILFAAFLAIGFKQALDFPQPLYVRPLYLYGVNLEKVDLSSTNLQNADLAKASLNNTDLDNANLQQANLWKAKLNHSYLNNANLTNAYLERAKLNQAEMHATVLDHADLSNATLEQVDLTAASLEHARLRQAQLSKADLSQSVLSEADLSGANLSGASLYAAILDGAKIGRVATSSHNGMIVTYSSVLDDSNLFKAILWKADLNYASLRRANLREVDLTDANLDHALLIGADLSNSMLENVNLSHADLSQANLNNADLYNADLSGAKVTCEQLNRANNVAFAKLDNNLNCLDIKISNHPAKDSS